jgi:hypothetical protein
MSEDDKTKDKFMKVVQSISFVFHQKPQNMYYVLNEVGSFDELMILALAANDMGLDVDEAYHLCEEGKDQQLKEKMGEVIQLWKKPKGSSVATVHTSKGKASENGTNGVQ